MKSSDNKKNKLLIVPIVLMAFCILGIFAIFIWDIVSKVKKGWTNNDTLIYIFFAMIVLVGPIVIFPLHDYFINHNKEIIVLSNDIYKTFIKLETNDSVRNYEKLLIDREKEQNLSKINSIIQKRDKKVNLTMDTLDDYFGEMYGEYLGKANFIDSHRLSFLYNKIKLNKSLKFEKLFRSVHNGDLIKNKKFPLFEIITPLLIGLIGLFVSVYQTLAADGSVKDTLLEYLKMFTFFVFMATLLALSTYNSFKDGEANRKSKILADLEKVSLEAHASE